MSHAVNGRQPRTLDEALSRPYPFAVVPVPTGGYDIVFPDLPGCTSSAATLEDVPRNVRDALATWIEATWDASQPIPPPTDDWDPSPPFPSEPVARLDGRPTPAPDPTYTAERVAGILDVTPGRVRQLAQERGLGQKIAGVWMFTPGDVVELQRRPGRGRPVRSPETAAAGSGDAV